MTTQPPRPPRRLFDLRGAIPRTCPRPGAPRLRFGLRRRRSGRRWRAFTCASTRPWPTWPTAAARAADAAGSRPVASSFSRASWRWLTWCRRPGRRALIGCLRVACPWRLWRSRPRLWWGHGMPCPYRMSDVLSRGRLSHNRGAGRPPALLMSPGGARTRKAIYALPATVGRWGAARTSAIPGPARWARMSTPKPCSKSSRSPRPAAADGGTAPRGRALQHGRGEGSRSETLLCAMGLLTCRASSRRRPNT